MPRGHCRSRTLGTGTRTTTTESEATMKIASMALCALVGAGLVMTVPDSVSAQTGMASYYKSGKRTANGERFDPNGMTAAHPSLPFGTRVKVVHLKSGRSVTVRINDRGPFVGGRVIDLSYGAAKTLGMTGAGVAKVSLQVVGKAAPSPKPKRAETVTATPVNAVYTPDEKVADVSSKSFGRPGMELFTR